MNCSIISLHTPQSYSKSRWAKRRNRLLHFFFSSQKEQFDQFQNQIFQFFLMFLLFYAVKSKALWKALSSLNIQHNREANPRVQARNEAYEEIHATPNNIRQKYPNSNAQEPPLIEQEEALIHSRGFLEPHFFHWRNHTEPLISTKNRVFHRSAASETPKSTKHFVTLLQVKTNAAATGIQDPSAAELLQGRELQQHKPKNQIQYFQSSRHLRSTSSTAPSQRLKQIRNF